MFAVLRNLLTGLILLTLLWGCCCTPPVIVDQQITPPDVTSPLPENWTVNGRISIINEQENWYAKFIWIQQGEDYQISFTGPLGETELQISQRAGQIHLKTPSGESRGDNLEQLIYQQSGWVLPVSSLRFWIQGLPDPQTPAQLAYTETVDIAPQISEITQAGWRIQYTKKFWLDSDTGAVMQLPKKITAVKTDMKIKLIVTRWLSGTQSYGLPVDDNHAPDVRTNQDSPLVK